MRWSKVFKRNGEKGTSALDRVDKVVVFGGGSFGTAMGTALARQRGDLQVTLLLRDPYICNDITVKHVNTRYLKVLTRLRPFTFRVMTSAKLWLRGDAVYLCVP